MTSSSLWCHRSQWSNRTKQKFSWCCQWPWRHQNIPRFCFLWDQYRSTSGSENVMNSLKTCKNGHSRHSHKLLLEETARVRQRRLPPPPANRNTQLPPRPKPEPGTSRLRLSSTRVLAKWDTEAATRDEAALSATCDYMTAVLTHVRVRCLSTALLHVLSSQLASISIVS